MYRNVTIAVFLFLTAFSSAGQKVSATFGEELKLKKGSNDIDIIYADKSGIYLQESHLALRTYFVIGASSRESATLVKMGHDLSEIYSTNFNKELKGKNFEQILFIKEKMYLFGSSYRKSDKLLDLYAAEIDKASGELKGDWMQVTSVGKESKKDDISYILNYSPDSSALVVTTSLETDKDVTFSLQMFDDKMKQINKPLEVNYPVEPKKFDAQHLFYTKEGNLLIVNRLLEYREGKKKKDKFLDFKEYDVRLYGKDGKMIKQINTTDISSKYIVRSRVQQMKDGHFMLAAFYADSRKSSEIKGVLFLRINQFTGEIINQGSQELSTAMLTTVPADEEEDDDDDKESRKERKERRRLEKMQEDDGGISKTFMFREFIPTDDGGFIMLSEKNYTYTVTTSTYNGRTWQYTTTTYEVYGDLLFVKISPSSTVEWMHMLPKRQELVIGSNTSSSGTGFSISSYTISKPVTYSSIGSYYQADNKNLLLFFNDHPKNDKILNAGQKVKTMNRPSKANVNMLVIDTKTGNYKRTVVFSNEDETDAMPSTGQTIGKNFYMVCKKRNKAFSKAKIALAKLDIK